MHWSEINDDGSMDPHEAAAWAAGVREFSELRIKELYDAHAAQRISCCTLFLDAS